MGMRRHVAAALVAAGALAVSACGADDSTGGDGSGSGDGESYTIGVVVIDQQDPDLAIMTDAMKDKAEELGATLEITDSKRDVGTELNSIEDLITRGVDAVILQPLDGEASQNAANRVIDSDIPLFILSTEFADGADVAYESYIGVDDTFAGEMQADYLNQAMPDGGKLVVAAGTYGASWTDRRKSGFESKINDNFKVQFEFQANGSRAEGKRSMEDVLQRFGSGEIDALVAHNDEMAIGAASAIRAANRLSEFMAIVGVDGTPAGVEAIVSGDMTASVRQDSAGQGAKAVEVAEAFLEGESVDARYTLPFTLITKDNVADFE